MPIEPLIGHLAFAVGKNHLLFLVRNLPTTYCMRRSSR